MACFVDYCFVLVHSFCSFDVLVLNCLFKKKTERLWSSEVKQKTLVISRARQLKGSFFVSRVLFDDGKGETLTIGPSTPLQSSFLCSCLGPSALFCAGER